MAAQRLPQTPAGIENDHVAVGDPQVLVLRRDRRVNSVLSRSSAIGLRLVERSRLAV